MGKHEEKDYRICR